ncbi:hypothetical protein BDW74DRAFT_148245 [Aspergillus multicolor]|uniref:uncharacterized protein n=1 Tax=Aspergillus multicolor TaxID=41759 RepID=UPI003CCD7C63
MERNIAVFRPPALGGISSSCIMHGVAVKGCSGWKQSVYQYNRNLPRIRCSDALAARPTPSSEPSEFPDFLIWTCQMADSTNSWHRGSTTAVKLRKGESEVHKVLWQI